MVGKGPNKLKTNQKLRKRGFYSTHSECAALIRSVGGDTLVVVRILRNNRLTMSKPCSKCIKFAKECGIRRIIYSDWNEIIREIKI